MRTVFLILVLFVVFSGSIFLQFYLSKKENKRLGLLLPSITFIISLVAVMGILGFPMFPPSSDIISNIENSQVTGISNEYRAANTFLDFPTLIGSVLSFFCLYNVPTLVYLVIYKLYRRGGRRSIELDKMSIQDL